VTECKDVFRLKIGADPPASVKPLAIKLRDGAEPVRMSVRKYAPPQMKLSRDKMRELEELGLVYKNTGAEWTSPPLILPKTGPDHYRMTVDLRVPNALTKPTPWPMPNLQNELHDLHGSEVFATMDFCQGYWQIPLHKHSQDCQSFITPDGVYTPKRVLHGTRNATQHLQSVFVVMMDDIKSNIKVWLDYCLLHTKTEDDLLATLNFFLKKCQEHGLELHASKCVLFSSTVRLGKVDYQGWCALRPKEYGSAAGNAGAAERRRLGSVCRGSKLDAKRHPQLLEACGPSLSSTSESVRG
jgi:hypothetical protein